MSNGWYDKAGVLHEADEDEEQDNIIEQLSDNNGQEYTATFTPDFDLSENGLLDEATKEFTQDVIAFRNSQHQNFIIFLKARQEHGNHLDNPEWYDRAGLAIKCWRYIKAYEKWEIPTTEEISDLANYATMMLSRQNTGG